MSEDKTPKHLWAECFGANAKIGDRICVKCGAYINLFDLRNKGQCAIPECRNS